MKKLESLNSPGELLPDFDAPIAPRAGIPQEIDVDDKLPCGLSRREINQMKLAGISRPDFIPWAEWNGPKRLNHRFMLIAHLSAKGYRAKDIGSATNLSTRRIETIIAHPEVQTQIKLIRDVELRGLGVTEAVDSLASSAVRVYEEILHDPKAKSILRQKSAKEILEWKLGKPNQKIDLGGSLMKDFYELLKKREDSKTIETSSHHLDETTEIIPADSTSASKDPMEKWLNSNLKSESS